MHSRVVVGCFLARVGRGVFFELQRYIMGVLLFFFFSSRRRHTRFDCDWSSDVCSSDLTREGSQRFFDFFSRSGPASRSATPQPCIITVVFARRKTTLTTSGGDPARCPPRSEERRGGKEWRSRWPAIQ